MVDVHIKTDMLEALAELPLAQQRRAVELVRALKISSMEETPGQSAVSPQTEPVQGVPFERFAHLAGRLTDDLADEMEKAIEDCERIEPDEW